MLPVGLFYQNNILSDELDLISKIDLLPWIFVSKSENSRKVQQYGFEYNYNGFIEIDLMSLKILNTSAQIAIDALIKLESPGTKFF